MGLFDIFKKKEETACDCGGACNVNVKAESECCSSDLKEEDCACNTMADETACCGLNETSELSEACDCGGACSEDTNDGTMVIKVLGSGCKKCNQLEESTKNAITQLGVEAKIEHVTDFGKIAAYGVMSTPALVINEKVVSFGKVLKTEEVIEFIKTV